MKITLIVILTILLLAGAGCFGIYYYGSNIAVTNFKVTYLNQTLTEENENFSGVRILYISDLEYGELFDEEKLNALADKIATIDYDLLIFGGDLFDEDYTPVSEDVEILTSFFNSIDCRLGKFAIYGDYDLISDSRQLLAKKVFDDSAMEILSGYYKIYNESASSYIVLYGYSYDEDFEVSEDCQQFTLAITHDYQSAALLEDQSDLVLCGNSHSRQVNLFKNDESYTLGENGKTYITNGVGLTKEEMRIFSDPEIVVVVLN